MGSGQLHIHIYIQDQELRSSRDPTRELHIDHPVVAQSYRIKEKWVPGVITAHPGLFSYEAVQMKYYDQQQHRHLGAIPLGYGSHLRNWTYEGTELELMSYEFWGRDVKLHKQS